MPWPRSESEAGEDGQSLASIPQPSFSTTGFGFLASLPTHTREIHSRADSIQPGNAINPARWAAFAGVAAQRIPARARAAAAFRMRCKGISLLPCRRPAGAALALPPAATTANVPLQGSSVARGTGFLAARLGSWPAFLSAVAASHYVGH